MPRRSLTAPQRQAYDAVAQRADIRITHCALTGTVLAAMMYVDHTTHSDHARGAMPTALALCASGTRLDRTGALTVALYFYAGTGAYARAVLAVADEYGPA